MAKRMMRVLHVLNELRPSGAEIMLRVAAPYFRAEQIDCEILSTGSDCVGPFAEPLADAGYTIHHIPYKRSPTFFLAIRKMLRGGRYDIVHLHLERASLYMAAAAFPFSSVVRTVHNNFGFTGLLRARRGVTRALSRAIGVHHLAIGPSVEATERDKLWNPTELALNWYSSDHFRMPTADERLEARRSFNLDDDAIALVSIGNCSKVKNHIAIIEALPKLKDCGQVIYLHAGTEAHSRDERRVANETMIGGQVRFIGTLSDVRPLLFAADLFVMPSLFEGLPISVLEALGCGVPVLLADSPGLRELREWYPEAMLCQASPDGVADGVLRFVHQSAEERRSRSTHWSKTTENIFGAAEGVRRYVGVYNRRRHR